MRKDAEEHAEEDKKKKEAVEARNQLDWAIFQAEKLVKDAWDKAEEADKKAVEDAVEEAKKVLENESASNEELKKAAEDLMWKMQTVWQKLYQAAQWNEWAQTEAWSTEEKKDDVVDAEVVDDKKDWEEKK
jgi:molecular chaperone DnaK